MRGSGRSIEHTPGSALAAGDVVDLGTFVGIALVPIAASTLGSLQIRGEFECTKYTGEAIAQGAPVYYDAGTNSFTGTIGYSEARAGNCTRAAAAGDSTVWVDIFPT